MGKTENIHAKIAKYAKCREQKKTLENEMKILADEIKEYTQKHGKTDAKGSSYIQSGEYTVGRVCKRSFSLNDDKVMKLLKARGLLSKVVVTVEQIDEEALAALVEDGTITQEEFESVTDVKLSYSVSVEETAVEEEMPEVQQTKLGGGKKRLVSAKKKGR